MNEPRSFGVASLPSLQNPVPLSGAAAPMAFLALVLGVILTPWLFQVFPATAPPAGEAVRLVIHWIGRRGAHETFGIRTGGVKRGFISRLTRIMPARARSA